MRRHPIQLLTMVAMLAASALPAQEVPPPVTGSPVWAIGLHACGEPTGDFQDPGSFGAPLSRPGYIVARNGVRGYTMEALEIEQSCTGEGCEASVILGYCQPEYPTARFDFEVVYAPLLTEVTVSLLNNATGEHDVLRSTVIHSLPTDVVTLLPVGSPEYQVHGFVEIEIGVRVPADALPAEPPETDAVDCQECTGIDLKIFGSDAISIRNVTLGPT